MTIEQLQSAHKTRPFKPFKLHLADGRSFEVKHPEVLAHAGGRTAVLTRMDDSFEVIDLLLVSSLEVSNGRSRRGK
jgi:hypothetical protein